MFSTNRDYKLYLEDISFECKNIKKFTYNLTYDEFTQNLEKVYAVAKAFENIGEAVKQIPKEITTLYFEYHTSTSLPRYLNGTE